MTTYTFPAAPINTTDTTFRTWGKGVSDGLAAVGMVKAADTGQINWATVLTPAAANTQQGYEIWRFSDAVQSTAPLFLRIGYGSGSAAGNPSMWVTIGKGSDGAGTITSPLAAAQQIAATSTSASQFTWYVSSGDGSMLAILPAPAFYVAPNWMFVLERSRTAAGAATTFGGFHLWKTTTGLPSVRTFNYATGALYTLPFWPTQPPTPAADVALASGGQAPLFATVLHDNLGSFWQPRALLVGMRQDTGALSAISTPFGTYLPLGAAAQSFDAQGNAFAGACVWWQ